ncbi:unnamed protein product [Blepharisma stoltei]|uniref:Calmodulin n=1 Tax=Blepharisma stoltei TaxID=1481888 RepID=A0AAU9IZ07_9CILI|nr:unnamed protein product [Blepharisma stoltei]
MARLTSQEEEDCQDIFHLLDHNKNQILDLGELGKGLRGLGLNPSEGEVRKYMADYDRDRNNGLSLEEFESVYQRCLSSSSVTEEEIRAQFKKLDKNGDGTLDARELKDILIGGEEPLTREEADALIADFDVNGDGVLSIDEFVNGLLGRQ